MLPESYQKHLLFGAILFIFSMLLYGSVIEPNRVIVKNVTIEDDALFDSWGGITILQLSDLHITRIGEREKAVIRKVAAVSPDVVCITGDLAQWDCSTSEATRFLKALKACYGVFVVLGDSDMSTGRLRCFFCHQDGNIHSFRKAPTFLRNNQIMLKIKNGKILRLVGISPDLKEGEFYAFWNNIVKSNLRYDPILVLSHFSSLWKLVPNAEHVLWLSGDTHGGQVWLPQFLWPLVFRGKDYEHLRGLFHSGKGKWLYVNQGLGTTREFPLRIGVPPEITVITFRPGKIKRP